VHSAKQRFLGGWSANRRPLALTPDSRCCNIALHSPESRGLTHLESIGLGNAASSPWVGRRPRRTHNSARRECRRFRGNGLTYFSLTKSKTKIAQTPTVTVWLDNGESRNSVIYSSHHAELVRRDLPREVAKVRDLAATPAGAVYIVDVNATGGGSHPIRNGTDDKVPPLRGARERRRSFVPDRI
jgi:hypothetical protein